MTGITADIHAAVQFPEVAEQVPMHDFHRVKDTGEELVADLAAAYGPNCKPNVCDEHQWCAREK